ncbi:MAG: hypothetical protein GXP63_03590 [DPANN group archaeon]|nr:hypothetical protein [DPANN group archaeon]
MAARIDRQRIYLIAIVAIVAMVAALTVFGGNSEPVGFLSDEAANIGGDASTTNPLSVRALSGPGNAYACVDSRGNLFRSEEPCR